MSTKKTSKIVAHYNKTFPWQCQKRTRKQGEESTRILEELAEMTESAASEKDLKSDLIKKKMIRLVQIGDPYIVFPFLKVLNKICTEEEIMAFDINPMIIYTLLADREGLLD